MRTLSVIKADVGGLVGHTRVPRELLDHARGLLKEADLLDSRVLSVGDDIGLIMYHDKGIDNTYIHKLAWDIFTALSNEAKTMGLYGAGQDLLKDSFSGNIRGLGPGAAEIAMELRPSEPVVVFLADKTSPGAFSLPLYKIFADPMNTSGLVIDPKLHDGFIFEVWGERTFMLRTPEQIYDLLALISDVERFLIKAVYSKKGEMAAAVSTERLSKIAGKYIGKDDPAMIVRAQSGFPAVGEILEPFALAHLVPGWMRGSHNGPLMPVSFEQAHPSRFDGPPRVIAAGFQLTEDKLIGPVDLFNDVAFERARQRALEIADYMRQHGVFRPHRTAETEYSTLKEVLRRLLEKTVETDAKDPKNH